MGDRSLKTILVCGGRDFQNKDLMWRTLDSICFDRDWKMGPEPDGNWLPHVKIVTGGAKGADLLAEDWAVVNWCSWVAYPADLAFHGNAAGPIRNQEMLDKESVDLVVAFPGGKGTADMVRRARKAKIEVIIVD